MMMIKTTAAEIEPTKSLLPPFVSSTVTERHNATATTAHSEFDSTFIDSSSVSHEFRLLSYLSLRIGLGLVFEICTQAISVAFLGHLPNASKVLAGTGLGRMFSSVTGISVAWGATSALWTLFPQAIGSKNENTNELLQIYFQRAFVVTLTACILLTPLQFFAGDVMLAIGQNPELKDMINVYCRCLIPFIYLLSLLSLCQRLGQTLNFNTELLLIVFIPFALAIPINYVFVYTFEWGWIGTALAIDFTMLLCTIFTVWLLVYKGYGFVFVPAKHFVRVVCSKQGLIDYLSLTIPGSFQNCLSWWIGEVMILFSGYITAQPNLALSATNIIYQLYTVFILLAEGIGNSLNIRLGKYIGLGSLSKSRRVIKVAFILNFPILFVLCACLYFFRIAIIRLFTTDAAIIAVIDSCVWILILRLLTYSVYILMAGVYRAMGHQKYVAYVVLVCNWMIGVGSQVFAFWYLHLNTVSTNIGVQTVWFCSTLGYLFSSISLIALCWFRLTMKDAMSVSKSRIIMTTNLVKNYGTTTNTDSLQQNSEKCIN